MKAILMMMVAMGTTTAAWAADTTMTLPQTSTEAVTTSKQSDLTADLKPQDKNVHVYLGQSNANDNNLKGIAVGFEYGFLKHFLVGLNYLNYSEKNGQPTNEAASLYLGGTVVQYSLKKTTVGAEIVAGAIQTGKMFNDSSYAADTDEFYGFNATVDYNRDIGLRYSKRISDVMGTEDMVSLVGYY